ncbi:hypothetical protein BLNAU_946 [Blattamonas nauphoetae]|uniref:Uncharacterized protein n=1 Tax=Blattamonas nauphoetae TaxID=2049346 RepID=A0ABQ9YJD0_9EUKA|nr:hypothetical protein BLNAU_946 [Blattamonas nauphoetae]
MAVSVCSGVEVDGDGGRDCAVGRAEREQRDCDETVRMHLRQHSPPQHSLPVVLVVVSLVLPLHLTLLLHQHEVHAVPLVLPPSTPLCPHRSARNGLRIVLVRKLWSVFVCWRFCRLDTSDSPLVFVSLVVHDLVLVVSLRRLVPCRDECWQCAHCRVFRCDSREAGRHSF